MSSRASPTRPSSPAILRQRGSPWNDWRRLAPRGGGSASVGWARTGAQGGAIDLDRMAIAAGLSALEGRRGEAIAGYRAAIAGWRDLGLPWDEAVTSIEFVRFIGPDEPDARAAAESARMILENLGAI